MAVSGDLSTLDLADLFQNIEGHARSGELTIDCDGSSSRIFFRDGKVALFACAGRPALADRVMAAGLVQRGKLEAARRKAKGSRRSLVDLLLSAKAVDESELRALATQFLFDDVADLIASARGAFRFQQAPEPGTGFDPDEARLSLAVAAGPLVLEASRRTDHWVLIRKFIPSDSAHFVARESAACPAGAEDQELGEQLLGALDGTRSVAETVDLFGDKRFLAYKLLAEFVRDRLVRAAEAEDLVRIARELAGGDPVRARRLLARGLEAQPHHIGLLATEAELAERTDDREAAAACLKTMAHLEMEAGQADAAATVLARAKLLTPNDPAVWERTLALAVQRGDRDTALADGMRLVQLFRAPGLHGKAKVVLERLLDLDPQSIELGLELARSRVDGGEAAMAVRDLLRLGKRLIAEANDAAARVVFEEALSIDSGHREARQCIERIDKDVYARARERRRRCVRWLVAGACAAVLTVAIVREARARMDLVAVDARILRQRLLEGREHRRVIELLAEIAARHPFTATALYDVPARQRVLQEIATPRAGLATPGASRVERR